MSNGTAQAIPATPAFGRDFLADWRPEDATFWETTGKRIAWRTLTITTLSLILSFATWFVMSAVVVRLGGIGFKFSEMELFWLTAMPGLAGGSLRLMHMFLVPIFGTRKVVAVATVAKLLPCLGLGFAVMNPETPFWVFLVLAFLAGFGGGDFSSYMPSTSIFFPKRLQGTALGIQAGLGNFGVSLTQFVTPWIVSFAVAGGLFGGSQTFTKGVKTSQIWLQNAAFWYVPFLIVLGVLAWFQLRSVPVKASFREQLDIFKNKHTWFCTVTYVMTFGSFSGLSAAFPLLIKTVYGKFPDAPDPLTYAWIGPLIGSAMRVLSGPLTDKWGGAIFTQLCGIGLIIGASILGFGGLLTPTSLDQFPAFVWVMLGLFFCTGIGNAATFRQYPVIFSHSPRQGAGVIGFTAAIAAYGPFLFSTLIGWSKTSLGSGKPFFIGLMAFCAIATAINWWFYTRKGCEKPS
ncbi:MAG: NarK/NasA family nitrate transporter [Verrucomicrobia bacterium]|nr:NarK/NasA family nitrate transporter [Verrucomicrobiota bacterium]